MSEKETSQKSALNEVVSGLKKSYGSSIIVPANTIPNIRKMRVPVPAVNYVSCGGILINRINELLGPNGSCKSYTMYATIAEFQHYDWANNEPRAFVSFTYDKTGNIKDYKLRRGYKPKNTPKPKRAVLIDVEHTYTPEWGAKFGIDNNGLMLSQPDRLSTAANIAEALAEDPTISLICFDSFSAVGTDAEIDNPMENDQMGSAARFWSKAIRKIQSAMNRNPEQDITFMYINNMYSKVGPYAGTEIRNGDQLKRSKSLSLMFKGHPEQEVKIDGVPTVVGRMVTVTCMKNKGGGPQKREAEFFYAYVSHDNVKANTTDEANQIVNLACKAGIVERSGSYFSFGSVKVQGNAGFTAELIRSGVIDELREVVEEKVIYNY